jgi:hypothetical protein
LNASSNGRYFGGVIKLKHNAPILSRKCNCRASPQPVSLLRVLRACRVRCCCRGGRHCRRWCRCRLN